MARLPDFEATVTVGETTHTVRTWCDTLPEGWEGTCAAYHKKKITDLQATAGGEGAAIHAGR